MGYLGLMKVEDAIKEVKNSMPEQDLTTQSAMATLLTHLENYIQLEEQGLLLRLPCKVGDTVWQVTSEVHKYIVTCIAIRGDGVIINTENYETGIGFSFNAKRIGQRYFLTKEEAEQKLEEMKGEV